MAPRTTINNKKTSLAIQLSLKTINTPIFALIVVRAGVIIIVKLAPQGLGNVMTAELRVILPKIAANPRSHRLNYDNLNKRTSTRLT